MISKFEWWVVGVVALVVITAGEVMLKTDKHIIKYDCRYAEISPDFPPQAREICRGRK